jgi:hypothetical protein
MSTPDYTQKISNLRVRVGQHARIPNTENKGSTINKIKSMIPKINTKSIIFYAIPSVVLIIIFLIIKPGFVCIDNIDKDNVITKQLIFNKVLITGLIGGTVISVGLFAYFRQVKNII